MRPGSLEEQTRCFQSTDGASFMDMFDRMPPEVRARARSSRFNLCAACIQDIAETIAQTERGYLLWLLDPATKTAVFLRAIARMEERIIACDNPMEEP